jgi:hypothetical protein
MDALEARAADWIARLGHVGDQHHRPAARPEPLQRGDGCGKGATSVVHHAPEVAEHGVVAAGDLVEAVDEVGHGRPAGAEKLSIRIIRTV